MKVTNDHIHAANRGEVQASKVLQEMKKHILVAIAEYHSLILASGICTTRLSMTYQEQTVQPKAGIAVSKPMWEHITQTSGN